jgi:hypothetical protein
VTRVGRAGRFIAAGFNTIVMGALAGNETGGRAASFADYVLWGAVIAAAICAVVIWIDGAAPVAWAAIGYVLFAGLLTRGSPHFGFILLALALAPMVPRPRESLALGIGIAAVSALISRALFVFAP